MQLIIPDCCLGEFCLGIQAEGHRKREDGTYYSTDDQDGKAFHYHNTDGSVFYRYQDGSEYYRRKNGSIQIRPPVQSSEKVEAADDATGAAPVETTSAVASAERGASPGRVWREWYDWPPQLDLNVGMNVGGSVTIRDGTGSTITFEPVGAPGAPGVQGNVFPASSGHRILPSGQFEPKEGSPQKTQGATFVQEWVKKQALADILSQRKDLVGA